MSYPGKGHPWADFLNARARVLAMWRDHGQAPEQSVRAMAMDPGQVRLILMTVDQHPEDYAPPPQPPTRDEVLEECAAFCDIVGEPWMAAKMRASKGGSELWEASPSPTERAAAPRGPCRFHGMGGDVAESCSRVPDCPSRVRRTAPTETPQEGEKK